MITTQEKPRKTHPKLTPAKIRELSELAKKIDAEEKDEIIAVGRKIFARIEKIRALIQELTQIRLDQGLSETQVCESADMGSSDLLNMEMSSAPNPSLDHLLRYAEAVGVDIEFKIKKRAS
jgi:DNA-binding phage protein